MSNIDKLTEKLKSAALKLNCEQWQTRNGFSGVEVIVKGSVAKGHGCVSYQPVASELVDTKTAKAIALFCPANILALLDELEAKEKRIAELEAQEVREEGNQFLVVRHPGRSPVIKHSAGDLEGFLRQLLEHDPMATIDIITHRYYGVGGQWVQDADEYLQMMAAAAGKGE
ncbi:ead/Ea22-like family protein [Enterobacter hormaechei]|uniref:ead/Ea22-like family protein n=1 Tax=Enterobacter hormaechei TaxID=158836 RepID=UPI00235FECF8|nr:ead/Ea22-like family protein [Enterobacter hormaechei]